MAEELTLGKDLVRDIALFKMNKTKIFSEEEIIERVQKGDKEAYQFIVDRYKKKAYFTALGFVHNVQDALDISQEAFIKAFRKIKQFDSKKPFFPWFYKVVKNLCLDYAKKRRKREEILVDNVQILNNKDEDREMKAVLWKGIDSLPAEQKEVILLRYFQQFSYGEIAEIMEKPVGTIMSSLYYAKRHLKMIIEKYLSQGN